MKKSGSVFIQRRKLLLAGVAVPVLGFAMPARLPEGGGGIVIRDGWILSSEDR